jgi:hypothetical protein
MLEAEWILAASFVDLREWLFHVFLFNVILEFIYQG